jgi:CBS domain-containing protein
MKGRGLYAVKKVGPAGSNGASGHVEPAATRVADVMTQAVVTAQAGCPVPEAARLMLQHRIGGLPVLRGEQSLVGLVTVGDLTVRLKPRQPSSRWRCFLSADHLAREYRRCAGTTVMDVMSTPVVTVTPEATVADAAALLEAHHIGRLPVVTGGTMVGILSRHDLLGLVAASPREAAQPSDASLAAEMRSRLAREQWVIVNGLMIEAYNGVLWLAGIVDGDAQRSGIETMARSIPGCRGVRNHLVDRRMGVPRRI